MAQFPSWRISKHLFIPTRLLFLFVLYSICRIAFYLFNTELFPDMSLEKFSVILYGGLRFDLTALLYLNTLYFLALLIPFRFVYKHKYQNFWNGYFLIINAIGLLANCADMIYYRFTLRRTTFSVFDTFTRDDNMATVIVQSFFDFWPVTMLFLLLIGLLALCVKATSIRETRFVNLKFYTIHSLLMFGFLYIIIIGIRGGFGYFTRPIAMNNAGEYVEKPREMSIVLNTPFTLLRTSRKATFKERHDFKTEEELTKIYSPIHYPDTTRKEPTKQNVVVLIIESYGKEHFGSLNKNLDNGTYEGFTPFLDSLIEESLVYTNAFANGRKSIDAIPSVVSGIPSLKVPYVISHYGTNKIQGLGNILKDHGYHTSFFHGAPNGSMGFNSIMKLAGFPDYYGKTEFNNDDAYDGTWGIWDEDFLKFMANKLNTFKSPFASTFFSLSSHHPFVVPKRYEGKLKKGDHPLLECVSFTDVSLREFFKIARTMPWFKNTLFVITADHATISFHKEYQTDLGAFRIPLIFYKGDGSLKGTDDRIVQQIDILPTVLDYLNINTPNFAFGSNINDTASHRFAINYINESYQLIKDDYLLQFDGNKSQTLYHFKNDIYLNRNIRDSIPEKTLEMETFLRAVLQQYANRLIRDELTVPTL